jgi:hypothetical protein
MKATRIRSSEAKLAMSARGEIVFKPVQYKKADTVLEGLSVYDDALQVKRPAVLVVHQWKGLCDYEKKRAEIIDSLFEAPCQEIANRPDGPWPPESVPGPFHRYERHIHTGFFQRGIK